MKARFRSTEFVLGEVRSQRAITSQALHLWTLPDETVWAAVYKGREGYQMRFPALADFLVSTDGRQITGHPAPGCTEASCRNLYLNQVLPAALSKQGHMVFHASAVDLGDCALAFVAESGRGKSTLAASFAANGFKFLTDDGLQLEQSPDGRFLVLPSAPAIRLWDDSQAALIHADAQADTPLHYTTKARFLADDKLAFSAEPKPLRRVYFLGDGSAEKLTIRPLAPAAAMLEWVKHSFLLDVGDRGRLASHFEQAAGLARCPIHFQLDYPRRYEDLPQLREALLAHAADTGPVGETSAGAPRSLTTPA